MYGCTGYMNVSSWFHAIRTHHADYPFVCNPRCHKNMDIRGCLHKPVKGGGGRHWQQRALWENRRRITVPAYKCLPCRAETGGEVGGGKRKAERKQNRKTGLKAERGGAIGAIENCEKDEN